EQTENIGARRLHTIMEHLVEDISFELPDVEEKHIIIDAAYVRGKFEDTIRKDDIDRFIL
ncbi:MAG: HslU--HslV peptidase ATPase subunit, partial [Firmicutes bacterium]|nr:HslU--HslV peptidase ATPase subunit [Bacillota bacterium]